MITRGIFQRGVGELSVRGRQELSKWLDRTWPSGVEPVRGSLGPRRFFAGASERRLPEMFPPIERERAEEAAEAICAGRFDLLGYRALSFGDPVDWHLDPISGRRAPPVHWSRIDTLDHAALGDARLIWELNRHQWLVTLGRAYRLTGRERYAAAAASHLRAWMSHNPPGVGINWSSSLEVALRLIAWCWAGALLAGSPEFASPRFSGLMRDWIAAHAAHVARYLSHYFSPNTHLTGEALALCYAGITFPELSPASAWTSAGARILEDESRKQILPDGVYFEQSTGYQRYTVEFYLHFLALAAANGIEVDPEVGEAVQRMLDFLLHVRLPSGRLPQIGDADGGSTLPLADRAADDTAHLFSTAALLFDRPDYAWAAGALQPETLWFFGTAAIAEFDRVGSSVPLASPSRLFPCGGYAVMAGSWGHDAHQLVFDTGPLGGAESAGHGHADLLSIQCAAFGRPFLVDPGTYLYTRHPGWRDRFRATAAHSTVRVDGLDQAEPAGPFSWHAHPTTRLLGWSSTALADFAAAETGAYRARPGGVNHRRTVVFSKPGHWVVADDLDGEGEHAWETRYQFAPLTVDREPSGWYRARDGEGHALLVKTVASSLSESHLAEGDDARGGGWVSPVYGVRRPAPMLVVSGRARLPMRVITVLVPLADDEAPAPSVNDLIDRSVLRGSLPPRP